MGNKFICNSINLNFLSAKLFINFEFDDQLQFLRRLIRDISWPPRVELNHIQPTDLLLENIETSSERK